MQEESDKGSIQNLSRVLNFNDHESIQVSNELKWKKAYLEEKQKHKLTRTVLDQALALSMKLLNEVKNLDVELYKQQHKNRSPSPNSRTTFSSCKKLLEHVKQIQENSTGESGSKRNSDEHSGMHSDFIRKSTEEIENIIRRMQFEGETKNSGEKPPHPPKTKQT